MDCSKTEVFLKEWRRMCKAVGCSMCEISKKGRGCKIFLMCEPAEAIKIVQEWSDAHPIKTRLRVFKEHYPDFVRDSYEIPVVCAGNLYNFHCPKEEKIFTCMECWNTPIEEERDNGY